MEKVQRDALTGHIEALNVELRIAKVTIPGVRDGLNVARVSAFTDSVRRICAITEKLAKTAGLNGKESDVQEDIYTAQSEQADVAGAGPASGLSPNESAESDHL